MFENARIEIATMSTITHASAITPEVIAEHGITPEEYERIKASLGREPSLTELGIFSVMWSEHCSYTSSRVHLKRLSTRSKLAVMDTLRFGPIATVAPFSSEEPTLSAKNAQRMGHPAPDQATVHRNHSILEGVVSGIASYGNCFGVPNLGGETKFEPCYSQNPLVNAFALGLVRRDQIFYARAAGEGNPVIYVGSKTGRDGIHGATMASEEFSEASEAKRPNVQVGDPFLEKLLLEACLEV